MPLPAPNLDDRRFQDFVDDAKRLIQRRIPAWTDHNVHDPGVTLIEAVATIADQIGYRLNQVPERHYRKFLDLLGIMLRPSAAARAEVTFRLSAPRPEPVRVPAGTQVATRRLPGEAQISFTTAADLQIVPVTLTELRAAPAVGDEPSHLADLTPAIDRGGSAAERGGPAERVACFSAVPRPGDRLYAGLSAPAPRCLVLLRTDSEIEGVGVRPDIPPLRWEAFTGSGWTECEIDQDSTGGLNRPGDILLHLPGRHAPSLINGIRAAWIRAVVTEPAPGQPGYSRSPVLSRLSAACVGGTATAIHADRVLGEILGEADGSAGQRFGLARLRRSRRRKRRCWRSPPTRAGRSGTACRTSPAAARTIPTSGSTTPRARWNWGRRSGSPTAHCAATAGCPRRAPPCGCASTGPAAAAPGTCGPARCACCAPRSRT